MTKSWPYSSSWIYISRADRVLTRRHYCLYSAAGRGGATSRTQRPTTKWKLLLLITRALFSDHDGFYDRIRVCCPSELVVPFKELQVPLPDNIITFYDVFKTIRDLHQTGDTITYKFTNKALENLAEVHDNLQNQKAETSDENRRGHITKAITQLIRLSGIIHVMENVFDSLSDGLPITRDIWGTE